MLLYSYPDTVHRVLLRKTQTSTPLIEGSSTRRSPQIGITPAVADCRYRAPLSPRLRRIKYTLFHEICQEPETGHVSVPCPATFFNNSSILVVKNVIISQNGFT